MNPKKCMNRTTLTELGIFKVCLNLLLRERDKFNLPDLDFSQFHIAVASFDRPSDRCAFVYRSGLLTILLVKECMKKFLREYPIIDLIFNFKSPVPLKFASLSNGPGFDFLGFMLAFVEWESLKIPQFEKVQIISLFGGWSNTTTFLFEDMQNSLAWFKYHAPDNAQVTQCDVLDDCSARTKAILKESDVVLLVKPFYKEFPIKEERKKIVKTKLKVLLSYVNAGAVVFFMDCVAHCNIMCEAATESLGSLLYGPVQITAQVSADVCKHDVSKETYGCSPSMATKISIVAFKFFAKAQPPSSLAPNVLSVNSPKLTTPVAPPVALRQKCVSDSNISSIKSNAIAPGENLFKMYTTEPMNANSPILNSTNEKFCSTDSISSTKSVLSYDTDQNSKSTINLVGTTSKVRASTYADSLCEQFNEMCHVDKLSKKSSNDGSNESGYTSHSDKVSVGLSTAPYNHSGETSQPEPNQIKQITERLNQLVHSLENNTSDLASIRTHESQNHPRNCCLQAMCPHERFRFSNGCCSNFSTTCCNHHCNARESSFGCYGPQVYPRYCCSTVTQNDCQNGRSNQSVRHSQGENSPNGPNLVIPLQGISSDTVAQILSIIQRDQSGC